MPIHDLVLYLIGDVMNDVVKTCSCCKVEKSVSLFYKHKLTRGGYEGKCKACHDEYTKIYYEKNKEKIVKYRVDYNRNNPRKAYRDLDSRFNQLIKTASYRNKFEVSITDSNLKELWENQEGRCAYTKLPLLATANQFNTVSLDRIDSSKGYVVGNVQLVCSAVNKMKQNYAEELFVLLSHLVTQNNKLSETPEVLLARYVPLGTSEL
jgi:hypothetical protein